MLELKVTCNIFVLGQRFNERNFYMVILVVSCVATMVSGVVWSLALNGPIRDSAPQVSCFATWVSEDRLASSLRPCVPPWFSISWTTFEKIVVMWSLELCGPVLLRKVNDGFFYHFHSFQVMWELLVGGCAFLLIIFVNAVSIIASAFLSLIFSLGKSNVECCLGPLVFFFSFTFLFFKY